MNKKETVVLKFGVTSDNVQCPSCGELCIVWSETYGDLPLLYECPKCRSAFLLPDFYGDWDDE